MIQSLSCGSKCLHCWQNNLRLRKIKKKSNVFYRSEKENIDIKKITKILKKTLVISKETQNISTNISTS